MGFLLRKPKKEVKVTWNQREVYKFSIKSKVVTSVKDLDTLKETARNLGAARVIIYTEENAVEIKYHRDAEPDPIYSRYSSDYDLIADDIFYADFGHGEKVTLRCTPISESKLAVIVHELRRAEGRSMMAGGDGDSADERQPPLLESKPSPLIHPERPLYPDVKARLDTAVVRENKLSQQQSEIKRVLNDQKAERERERKGVGVQK